MCAAVGWSPVCPRARGGLLPPSGDRRRILEEVKLLRKVVHPNVLEFYGSWFNAEKKQLVFITELFESGARGPRGTLGGGGSSLRACARAGTLKSYLLRYAEFLSMKRVKEFARLILAGLAYLHSERIVRAPRCTGRAGGRGPTCVRRRCTVTSSVTTYSWT